MSGDQFHLESARFEISLPYPMKILVGHEVWGSEVQERAPGQRL